MFYSQFYYEKILIPSIRNLRKIGFIPKTQLINDRALEYGFTFRELGFVKNQKILDVGYLESPLPFILHGLGAKVYGIDIRKCPISYTGINFKIGDIRKTNFKNKFFDRILAISTIEHLGISTRYGSYSDKLADRKAILEMKRILKDNGKIIITVPFGKRNINSVQKTYDYNQIKKLIRGLNMKKCKYALNYGDYWSFAKYNKVKDQTGYNSNIMMCLEKN